MEKFETFTIVDKKIYNRVQHVKKGVDDSLISKLVKKGVKKETIEFKQEDLGQQGCCPQMKVIAYGFKETKFKRSDS